MLENAKMVFDSSKSAPISLKLLVSSLIKTQNNIAKVDGLSSCNVVSPCIVGAD